MPTFSRPYRYEKKNTENFETYNNLKVIKREAGRYFGAI